MLLSMQSTQVGFPLSVTKLKQNREYINFRDHGNSAVDIVADTSSPVITEMDVKPISGRGYRPCFRRFLLNFQCPINQLVSHSAQDFRSYAHLDYGKRSF